MPNDPLSELLLDKAEVDRTRLARALKNLLGVDNSTGRIVLKPGFNNLNSKQKVLAYLLGKKAASLLGKVETEVAQPKEIPDETGIPKGTVNPKLRELVDGRLASQTDGGEYYVASHQILLAIEELEREDKP